MSEEYVLELEHIRKEYPGVVALKDVTLQLKKGEILALIGENGAGKSTLIKCCSGAVIPTSGKIKVNGKEFTSMTPQLASENGIAIIYQEFNNVKELSAAENLFLGHPIKKGIIVDKAAMEKEAAKAFERLHIKINPKELMKNLTVGYQQMVEIAKAIQQNAKILIMDEPSAPLTSKEVESMFEVVELLREQGVSIIYISHRLEEIMEIGDHVTILRDGKQVADLTTKDTNPEELSAYMIGRELSEDYHIEGSPKNEVMLELKHVSNCHRKHSRHKLENISLTIHKGEILGIAGVEGNGQKELAEVITGIQKAGEGEILLDGQNLAGINIRGRYEAGVSYISEDRLSDSLITGMNISENLVLREYGKPPFANHSIINKAAIRKNAAEKMKQYQVRASGKSGIDTLVKLLSGGNQQKLIIARELNDHAKVIVASQPTRGLDIGATEFVRQQLIDQRNAGKGVMLISADLEEIMALSDRIAVLFGGKIVGILNREEATVQKIGLLMGGISEEEAR